jgi:diguanylate cyclase (GGDEF)-like protein
MEFNPAASVHGPVTTERRNRILLALSETTERMLELQSLDGLLQSVAEHLINLTSASSSFIHLVNHEEDFLELVAAAGDELAPLGQRLHRGQGMAGTAWQSGEIAYVADYSQYGSRLSSIANVKQACAIPMFIDDEVVGVLGIMFTLEVDSIADQLDVLQKFASLANVAMQNAQLTERRQTEIERMQQLNRLAQRITACESMPALLETTSRSLIDHFNVTAVELWQYESGEVGHALSAWETHVQEQSNGKSGCRQSRSVTPKGQHQHTKELKLWIKQNHTRLNAFNNLGFVSVPYYQLADFNSDGQAFFVLLDNGKPWAMPRLTCSTAKFLADNTRDILHSVIAQMATAARLLRLLDEAHYKASHDALTELYNKSTFIAQIDTQLQSNTGHPGQHSIFFLDLDGFKAVNDLHGHAAGDRILQQVATTLTSTLDISFMSARLGGDEFAVWLPGIAHASAAQWASRLLSALERDLTTTGLPPVGASIGIIVADGQQTTATQLIDMADEAMYAAKRAGKGQFEFACGYPHSGFSNSQKRVSSR